jgi:hypothetical protein
MERIIETFAFAHKPGIAISRCSPLLLQFAAALFALSTLKFGEIMESFQTINVQTFQRAAFKFSLSTS